MSTKDEKDWLRAILEGKVKPGDAEWERIWKEEDFTGVRRVLKEVGMRKKDELVADREKMWRVVKQYRGEGKNRRRVSAWRWVSAAMLPLLLGGILWISSREKKDVLVAGVVPEIEAGTPRAVLLMEQGERIDLSLLAGDTILNKGDVRIRLDSSKSVTYERVTGTPTKIEYNTIIVPRKGEYQLILADGSKVYLNSESRLRFPTRFEGKERRVYLEGEGYFEVAKDTAKPFIVEAKEVDVRVLGTSFNVMSYDDEFASSVTLLSGKVETTSGHDTVRLSPGEQVSITSDNRMTVQKTDINVVVSWMDGKFGFSNERLDVIMRKICRWYDVEVLYAVPGIRERRFTGAPANNMPLKELLEALSTTTNLQFSLQDGVITIKQN